MSDYAQGFGWWLASDGKWYAPGHGPKTAVRTSGDGADDHSEGKVPETEVIGGNGGDAPAPSAGSQAVPPYRPRPRLLGTFLDRVGWACLWLIGAVVPAALMCAAASQLPSNPEEWMGTDQRMVTLAPIHPIPRTGNAGGPSLVRTESPIIGTTQLLVAIGPAGNV